MDRNKHIVYTKQVIKDFRHVFTLFLALYEEGKPNPFGVMFSLTRFAQPCIHTDALSVLLSALDLYLLPRFLIQRRMCTSGAGSSLFCALTVE
jgi:hypothetical protein